MTLDEAIKHTEEVAEKQENKAKSYPSPDKTVKGSGRKYNACIKCAKEHRQLAEWLKELKQLREQTKPEKCGDCISRKAATDRFDLVQSDDLCMSYDDIMAFLSSLPSVEPERKLGHWEDCSNGWMCSECKHDVTYTTKHCPNCGAKMEV